MTETKKVAIYARVSTRDKEQDPENQLAPMRAWCESQGHTIVEEYIDRASGSKKAVTRQEFERLFEDAHRRKFDLVIFWALDRFSREGSKKTIMLLSVLESFGVAFHSYTEPFLTTENELVRDILLSCLSALAKQESTRQGERVKAGMARSAKQGKKMGRKALDPATVKKLKQLVAEDMSANKIALELSISRGTAQTYVKKFR